MRLLRLCLAMTLITLSFSVPSFASNEKPVWVEAEGEAYMGDMDTPKEVMGRAKRDAERKAIERAVGTFINSHTFVSNSQLTEDLVYASVRGRTDRTIVIKEGWDEKDRSLYRVLIRALVSPVYPERGGGMGLKLSLSKTVLKEGEEVKVHYQTDGDCYVYVFSVASDGSVTLLFPNSMNRDNSAKAGRAYEFPPEGSNISLEARLLPGEGDSSEEKIKLIATREKEDIISLGFKEGMFQVYDANSTGLISDLVRKLNQLDPSDWAEAAAVYELRK